MNKKEKQEMKEQLAIQEEYSSESEEQFDRDLDSLRSGRYNSEISPSDLYQYKYMRLVPNSETDFRGLIDKDVVLANLQKKLPDPEYQKFIAETISAFKRVFIKYEKVIVADEKGKPILERVWIEERDNFGNKVLDKSGQPLMKLVERPITKDIAVFDETFRPIVEFLQAGFKYEHVASRAMGDEREAILDRTTKLDKGIAKKEPQQQNKFIG